MYVYESFNVIQVVFSKAALRLLCIGITFKRVEPFTLRPFETLLFS